MDTLNPNKRLKEEFVSNLTGSSFLEISALATLVPVLMLLRHSIRSDREFESKSKKNDDSAVASKSWSGYMAMLLADFMLIVFPTLLLLTVLAEELYQWVFMMASLLFLRAAFKRSISHSSAPSNGPITLRENISSYRVSVMIVTSLSILAVDFTIFPRRYAKTETYGSSLMDVGVGSFVLANSLVSRQARNVSSVKLKQAIKSTSPLIILGFARLLSTKGVDYQVHVGEYGVHWNFFFTLAAISLITSLINVPPKYCGILGAVILIGYQICLTQGLNSYLLSDKRGTDLISQNKEGILSIFGYLGLYLVGVQLGSFLFFQQDHVLKMRSNKWARTRVWILCLLFWLMTVLIDRHVERVSRRMCNLAYTTMVVAVNLQGLGTLMLSDFILGSQSSVLEQACNRNLLATFLLGNILTGLVNISTDTLFASPIKALSILTSYAFTLCAVICSVDFHGFQLKFW